MKHLFTPVVLLVLFCFCGTSLKSFGQLSITSAGVPVTQNFNTLAQSGTTNTWTDNTTIPAWYSNRTVYIGSDGASTTGALFSFGSTASAERALGALTSGTTPTVHFGVRLVNNTGGNISGLTITFRGEQWRQTANAQTLVFESQVGATSLTSGTWTANSSFNFTALKTGTAGLLDGNATGNFSDVSGTLNVAVTNGQEIWLRWTKTGSTSPGLSIDDISITANAAISSNADLSNLSLSVGSLSPAFSASTTSYTSSVPNSTTSITVTPTKADANATITVNGVAVASGSASGPIALNVGSNTITTVVTAQDGTTTKTYTLTVTRAAAGIPALVATSALADFGAVCINNIAGPNSFTLDGSDLDGSNISIAALSGFSYSETAGGTYTNTLTFSYAGNTFSGKIIYVKFAPTAVQSYDGNIVLTGGGVSGYSVPASGSGVNTATAVTTGPVTSVTATTATVTGTIGADGCESVTAYGFEYSLNAGFPNGTGTVINSSNLSTGNFSPTITNLTPNQKYYYKAFATTASATTYGTELTFTNMPLPVPMASQPGMSFTETFADIANWSNFFITGIGANHFDGLSINGSGGIPNGTTLTASTSSFQSTLTSGGVQKGTIQTPSTQSIVLLSTGSSDNTTSAGIDFYMDFSSVNAGTLSFDWASFNNTTGNRNGSLRVYSSVDAITFTELTFASVLNFTNNAPTTGSKNNIALPSSFNNNPNALLRFYYHNGTGGTTGSRPKISIDNLTVTAVGTTPCTSPTVSATSLVFGTITDVSIAGSFTASNPPSDGYVVVMSKNSGLTAGPVDGQFYVVGDDIGDGYVISNGSATSFNATGLTALTTYYFFVFPVNSICTGGPLYNNNNVLTASASTIAGQPACAAPVSQPSTLVFGTTTTNSIDGSFSATSADEYLVVRSTSATLSNNPANAQVYNSGDILGNGTVVSRNASTSFTSVGLSPNTTYNFFVFSLNSQNCVNGPVYNVTSPLTGTHSTMALPPCTTPATQPTNLNLTTSNTAVSGTFTGVMDADNYLIIRSTTSTLSATPADNTDYATGSAFGGGVVVGNNNNTSFLSTGLTKNTTYYFFVFASNNQCSGGTKYASSAPLSGSAVTNNLPVNNYYFGTLHSHSDYSDGNQDNPGYTPAQNYAFAKTALCMDYLGISEHNHFSSTNSPGNLLSTYHDGIDQATAFTSANPTFLALYGMEWGVISGGGHVLIYGAGMDDLWGWETGSGAWGASSNYDVYVPKSVYTGSGGLFASVNNNSATNTFASLAHPGLSDYNNLGNLPYDAAADAAISATAVESGPATSTNTSYSNPASPLAYLNYYNVLLSKGYHLGPTIDHDNHNTTFGKTTYSRTAVVSPGLSQSQIISSLRNMSFYATHDCDSKVDFAINTNMMGSIFTDRFAPNLSVTLTDASTATSSAVIRVMFGIPGSGSLPVKIDSVIGNTLNFTDNNLADGATGYYYLDISNGSGRIITSPIWYTRVDNSALPVTLVSFDVQKVNSTAKLTWTTEQELNSKHFVIERSPNGSSWSSFATLNAAGYSSIRKNYTLFDNAPMNGVNFYRLKMVDNDGSYEYSKIRQAIFNTNYTAEVAPNPAKDVINLFVTKTGNLPAKIELVNVEGKVMYKTTSNQTHIPINTQGMAKGLYFVKVIETGKVSTIRVMLQ